MPIYEFYCPDCHVVFNFLAGSAADTRRPACPRCERPELDRQLSRFATLKYGGEADTGDGGDAGMPDLDEATMERAMTELTREAAFMDEENPREAVQLMRRLTEMTGIPVGEGMREALRRLEAGEDPEVVEESLGDVLDSENPLALSGARGGPRSARTRPPERDEKLYPL